MMVRSWFLGQRGDSSGQLSGGQIGRDTAGLLRKTGTEEKGERKRKKRGGNGRRDGGVTRERRKIELQGGKGNAPGMSSWTFFIYLFILL